MPFMLKEFLSKIKNGLRQKEINSYTKSLIFSMRAAIFNAKSKNKQMSFNDLIRIAIPLRGKGWKFLKTQDGDDYFMYKNTEEVKIGKNDTFANVLSSIADVEIRSMYFGVINKNYMNVKNSGELMLQGLGESKIIEKIIREKLNKYTEDELQDWKIKK